MRWFIVSTLYSIRSWNINPSLSAAPMAERERPSDPTEPIIRWAAGIGDAHKTNNKYPLTQQMYSKPHLLKGTAKDDPNFTSTDD